MVAMLDNDEVDDYTVICKQKNGELFCIHFYVGLVTLQLAGVVAFNKIMHKNQIVMPLNCDVDCEVRRAHNRGLVGVWAFRAGNGVVGLVTVGHDSVKLWRMDETITGVVTLTSKVEIQEWRTAVQSADVTSDGKCICIVTIDSMFYEIVLGDEGPVVMTHDFGVMEAWHVRIAGSKTNYITTAFSCFLKEIDLNGRISRQEPFQYAKSVGALSYGNSNKRLAISTFEGVLHILDAKTLKSETTIEAHSKRIRALAFLPCEDEILTGSDDKTIKLHSVSGERPKVERVYCGHRSPILSLAIDERADGTRFASSSLDGQILLWHIEQPSALQQLPSPHASAVTAVVFLPTGRHLVSGGEDGVVACYRIPQAGMMSPGNIDQDIDNIGYLEQQDEDESSHMDHDIVHGSL